MAVITEEYITRKVVELNEAYAINSFQSRTLDSVTEKGVIVGQMKVWNDILIELNR